MLYLNNVPVPVTLFPDNTTQVWKLPEECFPSLSGLIRWEFQHQSEIFDLVQLVDLVRAKFNGLHLYVPFLPYGRQDKEISNDKTFALHSFADIINWLSFKRITTVDVHSAVAIELIKNLENVMPYVEIGRAIGVTASTMICFPDLGARNRYHIPDRPVCHGEKVRDQATGHITEYKLIGDVKDSIVLIVDDICDGGMTFQLLAKQLLETGAAEVHLYVTHGIFSKGLKPLKAAGIKQIFTRKGVVNEHQGNIVTER